MNSTTDQGTRWRAQAEVLLGPRVCRALCDTGVRAVRSRSDLVIELVRGAKPEAIDSWSSERISSLVWFVADVSGVDLPEARPIVEAKMPFFPARFTGVVPPATPVPVFCLRTHFQLHRTLDDFWA